MKPLDILVLSTTTYPDSTGGGYRMVYETSVRLAERGHAVRLIVERREKGLPPEESLGPLRIIRHPVSPKGVIRYHFSARHFLRRYLAREIGRGRPDVIISHMTLSSYSGFTSPAAAGIPKVYSFYAPWADEWIQEKEHEAEEGMGPRPSLLHRAFAHYLRSIEAAAMRRADRVIVLSDVTRRAVIDYYDFPEEHIRMAWGGFDEERFAPVAGARERLRRRLSLPPDAVVVFTLRRHVHRMGLEDLIEAFAFSGRRREDLFLVIGGDGPLRPVLEKRALETGLGERISFTGYLPEEDLPLYYSGADLFCLPTRTLEGFGMVTIEALACGTPVLATPVGGSVEILPRLGEEYLAPSVGVEGLKAGLEGLLPSLPEEERSGFYREFALRNYSWKGSIDIFESVLSEAASLKRTSA